MQGTQKAGCVLTSKTPCVLHLRQECNATYILLSWTAGADWQTLFFIHHAANRCGMEQELLSLALKSPPNVMLEAADYLLESGNADAAALLYQKGGHLAKALEMALSSGLYDVLDSIAEAIDQDANPGLMARWGRAGSGSSAVMLMFLHKHHSEQESLVIWNSNQEYSMGQVAVNSC